MLRFNISPSEEDRLYLFRIIKDSETKLSETDSMLNIVASILDNDSVCGGVLISGNDSYAYLYCFFEDRRYYSINSYEQLKNLISNFFPETIMFEVICIND